MDKAAAEQYLVSLFGRAKGYVAVAYKDKGESWQEHQFAWPRDKRKLLGWAQVHADANIFICPALRQDGHTRKKGDAQPTRWLWADVDWDKVPASKQAAVRERIAEIGTLVVGSGSGDNAHVYVRLNRAVDVAEHYRLNSGLREYLFADAKHADNSLLRLPGSTNWKTEEGSPVEVRAEGPEVTVDALMEKRTFRNVKVVDLHGGDGDWQKVDVSGVPSKAKRWARMPTDQAVAIYGSRHKAVWAIVGDMHRIGLDSDIIHTLMDSFPAAIDKNDDEHNGYDVHKDVSRRLKMEEAASAVVDDMDPDEEVLSSVTEEEITEQIEAERKEKLAAGVQDRLLRMEIEELARMERAVQRHTPPPPDTSESLSDALSNPPAPVQWLVQGLASAEANIIITGQYKSGKTALMLGSLVRSLVDETPFLDKYEVHPPEGGVVVGHWNLEMSKLDILDKYIRPVGIENTDAVKLAHWRGYSVNLMTDPGKDYAVEWLKSRGVNVWTIDSYAQLARMSGVNTNDNDEVYALMGALDEVKVRAGVKVLFMLGHTGRNADEKSSSSGSIQATRGASAVDEHVDARWVLTKDSAEVRYLATEGRDVDVLKPTALEFDEETKRMKITGMTKADVAADGMVQTVVAVLAGLPDGEALSQADLVKQIRARVKVGVALAKQAIDDAVDGDFVEVRNVQKATGGRAAKMHSLKRGKPTGDRTRTATPRVVDLHGTGQRRTRRPTGAT